MLISTVSESADHGERLAETVRAASAARRKLRIVGGDTKAFYGRGGGGERLDIGVHRGVVAYEPSELVITARAGTPIVEIESLLARHGQILAFEPPVFGAASTVGGVVAAGLAGSRRPFAGAVRDSVLGVKVLNGRGEALRLGGTVFKNVAGFDGFRLMAGALGCLGVLLEVSLRVAPAPAAERTLSFESPWAAARSRIAALMRRPLPLTGAAHDGERLHLRLAGAPAAVDEAAAEIGGDAAPDGAIWGALRRHSVGPQTKDRLWRVSAPPAAIPAEPPAPWLRDWAGAEIWIDGDASRDRVEAFASEVRGHATLFRGAGPGEAVFPPLSREMHSLHRRLKAAFDPAGVFNPDRMYEGL